MYYADPILITTASDFGCSKKFRSRKPPKPLLYHDNSTTRQVVMTLLCPLLTPNYSHLNDRSGYIASHCSSPFIIAPLKCRPSCPSHVHVRFCLNFLLRTDDCTALRVKLIHLLSSGPKSWGCTRGNPGGVGAYDKAIGQNHSIRPRTCHTLTSHRSIPSMHILYTPRERRCHR
jgi:hypothetical protein